MPRTKPIGNSRSPALRICQAAGRRLVRSFVIPKVRVPDLQPRVTLTESTFRKLENNPNVVPREVKDEISRLADRYQFFHWHLGFPNVFQHPKSSEISEDETLGWRGGFDVVIGNPPWDQLQLDPQEFFAVSRPDIAGAANMAARERAIGRLAESDPRLLQVYLEEKKTKRSSAALHPPEREISSHKLRAVECSSHCSPSCHDLSLPRRAA